VNLQDSSVDEDMIRSASPLNAIEAEAELTSGLEKIKQLCLEKDYDAALNKINTLLTDFSTNTSLWCALVQTYLDKGDLPSAKDAAIIASQKNPTSEWPAIVLVNFYKENRRYAECLTELNLLLAKYPQSAIVRFHLSETYLAENDFKAAKLYIEDALTFESGNFWFLNQKALIAAKEGDIDVAKNVWLRLVEEQTNNLTVYSNAITYFKEQKKTEEVILFCRLGLSRSFNSAFFLNQWISVLYENKNYIDILKLFQNYLAKIASCDKLIDNKETILLDCIRYGSAAEAIPYLNSIIIQISQLPKYDSNQQMSFLAIIHAISLFAFIEIREKNKIFPEFDKDYLMSLEAVFESSSHDFLNTLITVSSRMKNPSMNSVFIQILPTIKKICAKKVLTVNQASLVLF
jgi:tetratricopeptide (TPR) repeat protein